MNEVQQKEFAALISAGISTPEAQKLRGLILASEPLFLKDLVFKLCISNDILYNEIIKLRGKQNANTSKPVKVTAKCAKKHKK